MTPPTPTPIPTPTPAPHIFDPEDLNTCISCGFCLPSCPTYKLTGDEASSPRGRIALMRAIDDGTIDVFDAASREQASFCLGCRACEPVCPAGVPYGRLLEDLRDVQWKGRRRPLRVRPLLTFANSRLLIRLAAKFRLRRHAKFTPSPPFPDTAPPTDSADTLLLGCFERTLFPEVSRAAATTLPNLQIARDQGCCGALHAHNGDVARGERLARDLADRLAPSPHDPGSSASRIVSTAGGCAAHLSTVIGRHRVLDYSEALLQRAAVPTLTPILANGRRARIGLQDSCHLRNGMHVTAPPRQILAALGDYVEVPGAGDCCGAAGTYAILRRRDSRRVLVQKLAALAELDLDFLAVVNPGCQRQMIAAMRRARLRTRVMHVAELVALAAPAESPSR